MGKEFYLPENQKYTIFHSASDSVRFVLERCLTKYKGHHCAKSSFVDAEGNIISWHDFGTLEGPGWAANAVGGAYELFRFARFTKNAKIEAIALSILDHVLEDGFIDYDTGFIIPYRDTVADKFCLNFKHNNEWFCPGSIAKIGYQCLVFSDLVRDRQTKMQRIALKVSEWINRNIKLAPNGWYPRRSRPNGDPYDKRAESQEPDPIFQTSGDGLFILQLFTELAKRNLQDYRKIVKEKIDLFIESGGFYGSLNHDTYDQNENISYAVAFRTLRAAADLLKDNRIRDFAYNNALAGLEKFKLTENLNGCQTKGLLFMEETWDTAYLWENAEASLAYLEAYRETSKRKYLNDALTILRACAKHHHGKYGFLTEGVDWNNHVGEIHHFDNAKYGDIKYTEPLLNNLHIVEPTLEYLEKLG